MKRVNLSEWAVTHRAMVLFLIVAALVLGLVSFTKLGRLEDPNFNVPNLTAVVSWPGATAQEVQDQVLNRIERRFQELEHVDYVNSFARQGFGGITLRLKGGLTKLELETAWYQARKKIADARAEFPEGVRGPIFNDEYSEVYSVLYAVNAPDLSSAELLKVAEDIKRSLQAVPGVNKVDVLGKQAERVYVELSTQRLAALGVAPNAVFDALSRQNALAPSGSADGRHDRVQVRLDGALHSARDVADVALEIGGNRVLRISDVASVKGGYEDPPSYTVRQNGQPILALGVTMVRNGNILALGEALNARMEQVQAQLPHGVELLKYADQPKIVDESIWEFERAFLEALAIVLAVSFIALGWRSGLVVAASVPLVLGLVAAVMYAMGWNLDRISLGALIIALGLLVDDAIIAVEMTAVKLEEGLDRVHAATFTYSSTALPMLTGTLVTVAGFMPVGFAKSIAGEYAGGIFCVVGAALIVSWFVAVVFTPYLGVLMLSRRDATAAAHDPYGARPYVHFRAFVGWCMQRRWLVLAATLLAFLAAGAGMGLVQQQFFPTASRPELMVELRMREGASFAATEQQVQRLERVLKTMQAGKEVELFTAYTGAGAPHFFLSLFPELPNPSYAQFVIQTADAEHRDKARAKLIDMFAKDEAFPDARGRVLRLEFGPPVGFPVQFRVIGPDTMQVREIAYRVRDIVRQSSLVRDTQLDWNEQVRKLQVRVDQDKAAMLGLKNSDIQALVQAAMSGATATQIRKGEELVDVVVRATPQERLSIERLGDLELFPRSGAPVPLSQVARIEADFEEPVLWRRNRDRVLTVRSDVVDGVQAPDATAKIWPALKPVLDSLPAGYRIEQGGDIEESDHANEALYAVFPAMIGVTLLLLMIQLQSFSRMFMVFMTAPLGLIGVVPALLIFRAPFGFVALLGVIALAGMIMRNAVILVDQIDQNIARGAERWDAIVEATVRRARPVVLTAAAAILAMIPLTRSVFWGPMAIAIMGGLLVATALTLVFVPASYAAWFKVRQQTEPSSATGDAARGNLSAALPT